MDLLRTDEARGPRGGCLGSQVRPAGRRAPSPPLFVYPKYQASMLNLAEYRNRRAGLALSTLGGFGPTRCGPQQGGTRTRPVTSCFAAPVAPKDTASKHFADRAERTLLNSEVSEFGGITPSSTLVRIRESRGVRERAINWTVQLQRRMGDVSRLRQAKALNDRCRRAGKPHVGITGTLVSIIAIATAIRAGVPPICVLPGVCQQAPASGSFEAIEQQGQGSRPQFGSASSPHSHDGKRCTSKLAEPLS
ncbi:hypothetical protein GGD66_002335 [Bradyrhizobium sp. CIR48]|nr:hypothetical protein [Bradyrhizobium sp. CIR48]